jgi:hypothetical protein
MDSRRKRYVKHGSGGAIVGGGLGAGVGAAIGGGAALHHGAKRTGEFAKRFSSSLDKLSTWKTIRRAGKYKRAGTLGIERVLQKTGSKIRQKAFKGGKLGATIGAGLGAFTAMNKMRGEKK